jgi:hypothetical protein
MAKFKVGDKVRCVEAEDCDYEIVEGEVYTVTDTHEKGVEIGGEFKRLGCFFKPNRFELVEEAPVDAKPPTFDLRNTKIDVKAYSKKHGITLEKAHEEIQSWLLENGASWDVYPEHGIRNDEAEALFVNRFLHLSYYYEVDLNFYAMYTEKEITLSRQVVLTPSYVEEELVEFCGKMYNKREFLSAIANVKEKTNEC